MPTMIDFFFFFFFRRLLIENLSLIAEHSSAIDFAYEFDLFKMQSDSLSFEQFENLFDNDDEENWPTNFSALPNYDNEWLRNEVNNRKKLNCLCYRILSYRIRH